MCRNAHGALRPCRKTSLRRDKKTNGGRIIMTFAFCETKMAAGQTARRPGNFRTVHLTPLLRRFGTRRSLQAAATRMPCVCAVWGRHCALFDALAFRRTWRDAALKNENPLLAFAPGCFPNILLPCSLQTLSSDIGYRKISAARILDIFCAHGERQMRQKMNQAARIIHFRQKNSFLSEIYAFFCNLTCKFPQ